MNDKATRAALLTAAGVLDKARARTAVHRAGGQIAPSKYLPDVPRQVHAGGGRIGKDYGGALGYVPQQWVQQQQQLAVAQPPQPPKQQQSSTMDALTQLAGIASQKPAEKPSAASEGHPPTAGVSASAKAAMEALRKGWTGQDFSVVSDYRDPNKNEAVGGAKGSQHLSGNAFDIDTSGWTPEQKLALATQAYQSGFRGYGFYDNNMHFDVGGQRAWGPSYHQDSIPEWAQDWTQQYIYASGGRVGKADGGSVNDNLKNWFGDSVTHTDGVPHIFYTGTSKDNDFTSFNVGRHGGWFTRDPAVASSYAEQNDSQGYKSDGWKLTATNTASRVMPVHLKIEKPYTGELPQEVMSGNYKAAQSAWFDKLRAAGYDGWIPASNNGNLAVVLKEPQQVKSVYNTKFDPKQKHMNKAGGGEVDDDGIEAYHGSPHDFDQFDISKLGTGEGAQVYGHGLYFAGNEGIARYYRDTLRPDLPLVHIDDQNTGKRITESDQVIQNMLREGKTPEQYHQMLLDSPRHAALQKAYQTASDVDDGLGITDKDVAKWDLDEFHKKLGDIKGYFGKKVNAFVPTGHMYKVRINAKPHELLDWDKPLSQQHPNVQAAIKATGVDTGARTWENGADMGNGSRLIVTPHPDLPDDKEFTKYEMQLAGGARFGLSRDDVARVLGSGDLTGAQLHQRLVDMGNKHGAIGEHLHAGNPMKRGDKWAAETLMRNGIKGIRYRDAGSRDMSDGDPTHNYVMFHHDPVKVVKKYAYGGGVEDDPMIGQHNTSAKGVEVASGIGGIPMPSMAISKTAHPLDKFGDVTLLAHPSMITPSKDTNVWPADTYTGRQPRGDEEFSNPKAMGAAMKTDPNFGHMRDIGYWTDSLSSLRDADEMMKTAQLGVARGIDPKKHDSIFDYTNEVRRALGNSIYDNDHMPGLRAYGDVKRVLYPKDIFTASGNRKKPVDYTLDAVMKRMQKDKASEAGAENFNYGPGNFRAIHTPKFASMGEIKSDRGLIIPSEQMKPIKSQFEDTYSGLVDKLVQATGRKGFRAYDEAADALTDISKGRKYDWFGNVPTELVSQIKELGRHASKMPTEYFEAKSKRAIPLSSFPAALVPKSDPESARRLTEAGVKNVMQYGSPEERVAMYRSQPDLMFKNGGKAMALTRRFTKDGNGATLALKSKGN